jgi:hypothetical protein
MVQNQTDLRSKTKLLLVMYVASAEPQLKKTWRIMHLLLELCRPSHSQLENKESIVQRLIVKEEDFKTVKGIKMKLLI